MKSILETCKPRPDILAGTFNPEIFTASLSQVVDHYRGRATTVHNLYTDAEQFFADATYSTEGMQMVLSEVMARLSGNNAVPAIHRLETAFGGGKTHTLIALTHLSFRGRELSSCAAHCFKADIFDPANLPAPGEVSVIGIAGDEVPVHKPKGTALVPYTLWGEIAFQLGGEELYRSEEDDATSYAAPGKPFLEQIFSGRKAILVLDELAQYATRFNAAHPDGADQLAAFLMALNGYARTHSGLSVVLTLASQADAFAGQTRRLAKLLSEIRGEEVTEDDAAGMAELAAAGGRSVVSRDATGVVPVQANEISRVLAKRLFVDVDQAGAEDTISAYWEMYQKNAGLLPDQATREDFRSTLRELYPFHPTFIEFLNQKMATLENFQGTRGVLRVLALAVRSLWEKHRSIPMIQTCHLNLRDARIVNEIISRTGGGELLPILNTDIGGVDTAALVGGTSRAQEADRKNPHPQGFPLHEYTWKAVFLHSLVGRSEGLGTPLFGIAERDALFETSFPGMTPPQVQTALQAIEDSDRGAFYLRHSKQYGRYYASLDASINRALAIIRGSLEKNQVTEFLDAAACKIIRTDPTFQVSHDVSLPEHIQDKRGRACLGLVALGADQIDTEAFVTTAGPNRPRIQQNLVFLLVPRTVHIKGEVWSEDRVWKAQEAKSRLQELARNVIARSRLRDKPENHGIKPKQLAEEEFDTKTKERDFALQTTITQQYDSLWYPSASGQVVRKEIHTAGGESGASIVEEIRRVLRDDGELITEDRARTREGLTGLGQLFFGIGQTPTLEQLRTSFTVNRRWPVLDSPTTVFDQIIREGVTRGFWCLFRMASEESIQPDAIHCRDTDALPLDLDLSGAGWSIVSLQGAKQRGWLGGAVEVDPARVETWVSDAVKEQPAAYASQIIDKVVGAHGDIPEKDILTAIDSLLREDRALSYAGESEQDDKPVQLMHGPSAILHSVSKDDVVLSPAEAARRGWVVIEKKRLELQGREAADKLLPLLKRIGSLYSRGAKSKLDILDLVELRLQGGGRMRLLLQDAPPEDLKLLGELFEILGDLVSSVDQTQGRVQITDPQDDCPLVQELKKD